MTQTLVRNNGLGILEGPFYYLKCERIGMAKVGAQPSKIEESQIEKREIEDISEQVNVKLD